jgi:thiol-disulfide isomerase/thioredoxin
MRPLIDYIKIGLYIVSLIVLVIIVVLVYRRFVRPYSKPTYVDNKEFVSSNKDETAELIFFHTTWCPYCKQALPTWNEMKSDNPVISNVTIIYSEVDCERDENTARKFNVTSYPTIKLLYKNNTYEYDAKPDINNMKKFIELSVDGKL